MRLAEIVSDRVESLAVKTGRTVPAPQLLALAALDLADDLLAADKRAREIEAVALSTVELALERLEAREDMADPHATLTDGTPAP